MIKSILFLASFVVATTAMAQAPAKTSKASKPAKIAKADAPKTKSGAAAAAQDPVMKDFDSLGGNSELMEKVRRIEPDKTVGIVQNRSVDRFKRLEVAPEFISILGGDAYLNTAGFGIVGQYHWNPYVSFGLRYNKFSNKLSNEGRNIIDEGIANGSNEVPGIDQPLNQSLAVVNFYPIYGKLNMFNRAVTQFDVYASGGIGTINLKSGGTRTWTGGAGVGLWFTQHLSTRLEVLYQSYTAKRTDGEADMNVTVGNLQIGYLL